VILTKYNREIAHQMVDSAPDGHVVEVKPAKRSLEQNRLYWAILSDISEQVVPGKSYEPSVWHEYLRALFLPERFMELPDGSVKMLDPSTAELSLTDFSEYVEKVIQWALQHDVKLSEEAR
jgi:hypothetical protein